MTLGDIIPWSSAVARRRRPTDDLIGDFFRDIERVFDDGRSQLLPTGVVTKNGKFIPTLGIEERDREYLVTAEIPGMEEKDINVEVTDEYLTISGEKEQRQEKKEDGKSYTEHSYGSFLRRIAIPQDVDRENVEASMKNGVLTLKLPKALEAKASTRKLPIKAEK